MDTTHKVLVKFEADTKGVEAGTRSVAKEANKLSKQQKMDFGDTLKRQKQTTKIAGPQQQRLATAELKKQNQEYRLTNRLLTQMAAGWQRVAQAAKSAAKAMTGGGKGRGGRGGGPPPSGPPGGPGGPGGGGGGGGGRGWVSGLASTGIGLAGGGLAALAMSPIAAISSDYQAYVSYQRSLGGLAGLNKGARFGAGYTMAGINKTVSNMADLGYMPEETVGAAKQFGRATGSSKFTERGMSWAKALGMDTGDISSLFNDIRRGQGGFGEKGMKDFQKILQAAVKGGVDSSTLPEYLQGISSLTSRAAGAAGGSVSALPYAQLLAMFEKSGAAGLKGARGASVLSALEEGYKAPGGGDEGLAVIMGSLGFGRAGGNTSYYQAKKMQEQGFAGKGGADKLKNLFDYVDKITGGGEESNLYMEGLMGGRLTLDQLETVHGAINKGGTSEDISKMLQSMTATELDRLTSIDDNMKEFLHAGSRAASLQKQGIDRGEKYADSIEKMQDIMQQFFDAMQPLITKTLPALATGLEFMTSGMTEMVHQLSHVASSLDKVLDKTVGVFGGGGYSMAQQENAAMKVDKLDKTLRDQVDNMEELNERQLRRVIQQSMQAHTLHEVAGGSSIANVLGDLNASALRGIGFNPSETDTEAHGRLGAADLAIAARALDKLADRMGRGSEIDPSRIRTEHDLIAAMTALGIAIPAGSRARVDAHSTGATGGAP